MHNFLKKNAIYYGKFFVDALTNHIIQFYTFMNNNDKLNLGHTNLKLKKSWHNYLNNFYLGKRNNTIIFDYKCTSIYMAKALHVFTSVFKAKGNILIINTNPELSKLVYILRKSINASAQNIVFSDCGWTKGTLTNWDKVFNKVQTFVNFYYDYNTFLNANNIYFPSYKKMKKNYKGFILTNKHSHTKENTISLNIKIINANWKPDLLLFMSNNNAESIFKEAALLNIPTIAFIDSNSNSTDITYPIPGNAGSYPLIWFFFTLITKVICKIRIH